MPIQIPLEMNPMKTPTIVIGEGIRLKSIVTEDPYPNPVSHSGEWPERELFSQD